METKIKKIPWWTKQNKANPGLNAMTNKKHTLETKRKIGIKSIGRKPMLGKHHTQESKIKIGMNHPDNSFENNPMWKGNKVGYGGVHFWIIRMKGQPKKCEICGEDNNEKNYEWSNKSRLYKRDLNDWQRLCISCHRIFDKKRKQEVYKNRNQIEIRSYCRT